jgi:hypothetical protein
MVRAMTKPDGRYALTNLAAGIFVKPWRVNWDLAPKEELIEYVCENNRAQNMVGK